MNPYVDPDLCISCGLCVDLAPDVFQFNDEAISTVIGPVTDTNRGNVLEAIEACPTEAIKEGSQ